MTPQGLASETWSPPPPDSALTLPGILDFQLTHSPDHVAYVYEDADGTLVRILYRQFIGTVYKACAAILRDVEFFQKTQDGKAVVAVFANTDSLTYSMLVTAIMRAGFTPFCISPRSAAPSLANLLRQTKPVAIYVAGEAAKQELARTWELLESTDSRIRVFTPPTFDELQDLDAVEQGALPQVKTESGDATALILHSSGSTSIFTKPVYISHTLLLNGYALRPWTGAEDYCGKTISFHATPNFHGIGVFAYTWPFTSGITIAVFNPEIQLPAAPETALAAIRSTNSDIVLATPMYIEASFPVNHLLRLTLHRTFVGAALNKRVGDLLVKNKVPLCSYYGSMETGILVPFFQSHGVDWEYITLSPGLDYTLVPEEEGGLFSLVFFPTDRFAPCWTNLTLDERAGCHLSDLFEAHPDPDKAKAGLIRLHGRKDDQINLSTGAKMNPVPTELQIMRHHDVEYAVVFGVGKPSPGVLIQLKSGLVPSAELMDGIWVTISELNQSSPTHFRISRSLVLLSDPGRPFSLSSKGVPRRRVVYQDYEKDIEAAY
ncbi:Acetyl-CoA synthetase-like protein [Mycena kentingensis (nom. inval.)]|nr:Acetyl-CoA synthetase-like protein [Mycena kentingensis (nom. inval.)]